MKDFFLPFTYHETNSTGGHNKLVCKKCFVFQVNEEKGEASEVAATSETASSPQVCTLTATDAMFLV
jgi:hypothetical protein